MTIAIIPEHHFYISCGYAIQEFSRPFFARHNINYFQFFRVYKDSSFIILTNQSGWLSYAMNIKKMPVMSTIDAAVINPHSYNFLWDTYLPEEPLALAREQFNIANGICFVYRQKEWYELIAFATPKQRYAAVDRYFNHYHELQAFILNFRHNAKSLLNTAYAHRLTLPDVMKDKNENILLNNLAHPLTTQSYPVSFNAIKSYITPQELKCLHELAKGNTVKQIAQELDLSARTIETYLTRVKSRFDIAYRKDLIKLIRCQ